MDLRAAAEHDVIETWCALSTGRPDPRAGVERHDGLVLASTGAGVPFFNGAFVTDGGAAAPELIEAAIAFYARKRRPYVLRVPPERDDVAGAAADAGLREVQPLDLLAMPIPAELPGLPPGIRVEPVGTPEALALHAAVLAASFELPVELMADFLGDVPLRDARLRAFNGWDGEIPVTTSAVFLHGDVAGVYDVATITPRRARGLGEAMTWHAIRVAAEAGAQTVSLQPSAMGLPIYTRMGFGWVGAYRQFEWRPAPEAELSV